MRVVRVALAALAVAALALARPSIDPNTLTVSGISAGACFTVQYQVAHSTKVRAVGVIAGAPFYCAQDQMVNAMIDCMEDPLLINIGTLNAEMNISASQGFIDPVSNIEDQAVMLFSGLFDTVVSHGTMELLAAQYQSLGVKKMVTYFNYSAEHAWITNQYGNSCSTLGSPYINNCGLDFAGEFLRFAWDHMSLKFNDNKGTFNPSNLLTFSQTAFGANGLVDSLDTTGYYYVPTRCNPLTGDNKTKCHVHLNLHGCTQDAGTLGTTYVSNTGLNEWAEANDIIIIYPQAAANLLEENPNACFNWWGYGGDSHYADKEGVQMTIFEAMVNSVMTTGALPAL
jgi:poly(3-hydroxybutyrate) depolymerase